MAKIYSNGELIEEDVLLPLKICQTCDIGYGTPELIEYIHTVYRKMHINPMQLRKNDIGNGNVNDIKLRIQMQNSFHNKHKSKNGQYPEVDKLLGIIQKEKINKLRVHCQSIWVFLMLKKIQFIKRMRSIMLSQQMHKFM